MCVEPDTLGCKPIWSYVGHIFINVKKVKVKISLFQAVEAHRVARG
jgi:hypothetical protein